MKKKARDAADAAIAHSAASETRLPPPTGASAVTDARRSRRRRRIFRIVSVALPILLVGGAELILRLRGYGGYPPVIKHVGSDGKREWYSTNRPGVDTFFYRQLSLTGGMRTFAFNTPKPPDTVRICFFGDSAMQGYPQPLPLTNGAFLQAMLNDLWGTSRRAEVLNFGCTAVASFASMNFLEEMLPHQADLIVIMAGNNEFYGAYGVASLHRAGTSPGGMKFMRWTRSLGLAQWLDDVLLKAPKDEKVRQQTLMERVAAVGQIGPDDSLRPAAEAVARTHLTRMVALARAKNIPTIICSLPTNERGMFPVGVDVDPPLPPDQKAAFEAHLKRGEALFGTYANPTSHWGVPTSQRAAPTSQRAAPTTPLPAREGSGEGQAAEPRGQSTRTSDATAAAEQLRAAIAIYGKHARSHFLMGMALTAMGRHEEAAREYITARDLDTMPWRSPTPTQNAARDAAAASPGAVFCNMEAAFRADSPGGAIGWELMDDHVHMSLRGQALFARTIANAMTTMPGPLHVDADALARLPTWEQYAQRLGQNEFDAYAAATRMRKLYEIGFMSRANPAALERIARQCDDFLAAMTPVDRKAVDQWRDDPSLHVSNHRPITSVVGFFRMAEGDFAGAAALFRIARDSVSPASLWRLQTDWYLLRCRRHMGGAPTNEDRRVLADALETGELLRGFVGFRDPLGPSYLGMAYNLAGNHKAAIAYLDDAVRFAKGWEGADVVRALADSLIKTGQLDRARKLLNLALRDDEMRAVAQKMLAALDAPSAP